LLSQILEEFFFHDILHFQKWGEMGRGCRKFCPISAQDFAFIACVSFENSSKLRVLVARRIYGSTMKFENNRQCLCFSTHASAKSKILSAD
jgi:hypothetical protein